MEGRAEWENSFAAAGVDVDHDANFGKDGALQEVRNPIRQCALSISGKSPVHVHSIKGRHSGAGTAGAFTQLRHEHDKPAELACVEIKTQPAHGHLPFVFVTVSAADNGYAGSTVLAADNG